MADRPADIISPTSNCLVNQMYEDLHEYRGLIGRLLEIDEAEGDNTDGCNPRLM